MSIWDAFGRSMSWDFEEPDLTGHGILGVYAAGERSGAITIKGGRLVLTDKALIYCPMDLTEARKVVDLIFTAGQIPGGDVVSKFASLGRDDVLAMPLANIASVEQTSQPRLLSPPSIRVATKVGSNYDFSVLAGQGYPSAHPKNNAAIADLRMKLDPLLTP
jgi:hypothetical protein